MGGAGAGHGVCHGAATGAAAAAGAAIRPRVGAGTKSRRNRRIDKVNTTAPSTASIVSGNQSDDIGAALMSTHAIFG